MSYLAKRVYHSRLGRLLSKAGFGRFHFVRKVYGLLISSGKESFVNIGGHKIFLDPLDSLGLREGKHSEFERKIIEKNIRKGDTVLDVGANIGYFTLIMAKIVGDRGKVFAFEPDPKNFSLLKRNVEVNGYKNVVCVNKAVSDKNEKIKLYLSEYNSGDHRIYDSKDGRDFVEIESVSLDEFLLDKKVDFIKMDIQGAEERAFKGMEKILMRNKDIKIIAEFWPIGLERSGVSPREFMKYIRKLGFKIYEIGKDKEFVSLTSPDEILRKYTIEKRNFANLLCKR